MKRNPLFWLVVAAAIAAGCSTSSSPGASVAPAMPRFGPKPAPTILRTTPIKHVIIVIQENRSFDDLFMNYPGANTQNWAMKHDGTIVNLAPVPLGQYGDLSHLHTAFLVESDGGKMDGFDLEKVNTDPKNGQKPNPLTYTQQSDVQPYWDIAAQNALADDMYASVTGPSYPAHLYLIAGGAQDLIGLPNGRPWGCAAPAGTQVPILLSNGKQVEGPFPCFDWPTLADELDKARISWKFYAPFPTPPYPISDWSTYLSINHIYNGPDWAKDVVTPETTILTDIANGNLPHVSWVTPKNSNSDHADNGRDFGPSWIASIVNAVGANPQYAKNTVIFVTWDEWGGWFDHVYPPQVDLYGLGFRVPLLIVSGYTKPGYISHVQHEFGSVLRFTEENWGLGQLGPSDTRADDLMDAFDFTSPPHAIGNIHAPMKAQVFIHQTPDPNPVDTDR